jgi:predicted RNA-binding Zn-ribbon protein involved in translation (DUF1610 family)
METLTFEVQDPEQARSVLKHCLLVAAGVAKKARKKDEELGLDTTEHELFEVETKRFLKQLGWTAKGERAEDPAQLDFTKDAAAAGVRRGPRVDCTTCATGFAVPVGEKQRRRCPGCGDVYEVTSDEDGVVTFMKKREQMPTKIAELWSKAKQKLKLSKVHRHELDEWLGANPDWIESPELVERGARVADPDVPGSGNPLRIDCSSPTLAGTECSGFDATDTPGSSVCPKCGQKYVVSIEDGRPLVRLWSQADEDVQE